MLIVGLAATPVAAKAAVVLKDAPSAADQNPGHKTGMPDCHGMAHKSQQPDHTEHAQHMPGSHQDCPDCDKSNPCTADLCQLKCFKVFGDLIERAGAADKPDEIYFSAPPLASEPVSWKPRTPPPRS